MHIALIGLILVLLCGGAVRIFQERTHDRLKGEPLRKPGSDGEPQELGVAINIAAEHSARALDILGSKWRLVGLILIILSLFIPILWLGTLGYFILMAVLKHERLGPWRPEGPNPTLKQH